jgi:hypothetical protein
MRSWALYPPPKVRHDLGGTVRLRRLWRHFRTFAFHSGELQTQSIDCYLIKRHIFFSIQIERPFNDQSH